MKQRPGVITPPPPASLTAAEQKAFVEWLRVQGAEVYSPTNGYEVARFRARGGLHVVYRQKGGDITAIGFGAVAIAAFKKGENMSMGYAGKRRNLSQTVRASLLDRDGDLCFFCGQVMDPKDMSIEHLVPKNIGGPDHVSNLVLAHTACNQGAGQHASNREDQDVPPRPRGPGREGREMIQRDPMPLTDTSAPIEFPPSLSDRLVFYKPDMKALFNFGTRTVEYKVAAHEFPEPDFYEGKSAAWTRATILAHLRWKMEHRTKPRITPPKPRRKAP